MLAQHSFEAMGRVIRWEKAIGGAYVRTYPPHLFLFFGYN